MSMRLAHATPSHRSRFSEIRELARERTLYTTATISGAVTALAMFLAVAHVVTH